MIELNFYCDAYGLDTISVGTATAFAMECFELGLITAAHTGGLELYFGNRAAALEIVHQMARGEGFGKLVGQGVRRMKAIFAQEFGADPKIMADIGMEAKGLEFSEYMTKESLAQQGGYGLALKGPQHDEAWLIFLDMVHNFMPTFEQKAEALHWFPMFRTWFSLCGLCKLPWNDIIPEDNQGTPEPAKVMKHVQLVRRVLQLGHRPGVRPGRPHPHERGGVQLPARSSTCAWASAAASTTPCPIAPSGPVTELEYESRAERYDKQFAETYKVDIDR
ncbi:MAG: aldehyde ferredoxin oxidoreductase C-terminal domain-containing protein [Desulfobacterales bacterium]|nr:aldehyde ferredoxin oxidoreductase C-terminal domain-containing protein [Desulfobacterales bacterium]